MRHAKSATLINTASMVPVRLNMIRHFIASRELVRWAIVCHLTCPTAGEHCGMGLLVDNKAYAARSTSKINSCLVNKMGITIGTSTWVVWSHAATPKHNSRGRYTQIRSSTIAETTACAWKMKQMFTLNCRKVY
jgi:hypothetical protein